MYPENRQPKSRPGAKPSARITLSYGFGRLDPAVPEVDEALHYYFREFVPGDAAGYAIIMRSSSLSMEDFRSRTIFPSGLMPRVIELLHGRGYAVTISDERAHRPQQIPDANTLAAAKGMDRVFLEAIAAHPLGQIEVSGFQAVVRRISQIANLFLRAKVVVVAGTNRRAGALRWALAGALQETVGRAGHRTVQIKHRIVVSSPAYLDALDSREVHVVIIPDVCDLGNVGAECIGGITFDAARTYLFRRPGQNLGARTELRCEAMGGRLIFRLSPERAAVRVQICRAGSFLVNGCGVGLQQKRTGIWHNDARNEMIAKIADAFVRNDRHVLWEAGLMLNDSDCGWLDHVPKVRVQVLVESTEHAQELQRRLPTWRVRTNAGFDQQSPQSHSGTIVTLTATELRGMQPEVLIRADGGSFPLNVRGVPPWKKMMPGGRMYVVDVDDAVDSHLRGNLLLRISQYRNLGWEVEEPSSPHFSRPEGKEEHSYARATRESRRISTARTISQIYACKQTNELNRRPRPDIAKASATGDPPSSPEGANAYRAGHPTAGKRKSRTKGSLSSENSIPPRERSNLS